MGLKWTDHLAIAEELFDRFPDKHPLAGVRFDDLHRWIVEIPDFDDDPKASTEGILEGIQMSWWEEFLDEHPGTSPYARAD